MGYLGKLKQTVRASRSLAFRLRNKFESYYLYYSLLKNAPVVVQDKLGITFILHPWDRLRIRNLIYRSSDEAQFRAMSMLIGPDSVVFDVGAHIGRFSVFAAHSVGPHGKIFAFEPVPDIYWMLCQTLALNRCSNVMPLNKALSNKAGNVRMNLFDIKYSEWNTMGMPRMTTREGKPVTPNSSILVDCETIDKFCSTEGISRINFLKLDVEGFEKFVFLGAERFLREHRVDHICFEISQDPLKGAGVSPKEIFELLELHGYYAFEFDEESSTFRGPVHDSNEYWANYFASWQNLTTNSISE